MATREIKTRFKLEGEQQYKSAMSQAASAVKMLNSEEKLAKAQFQATGDAQAYAAAQADILKRKITEQKSAVAAAEKALKALTANGVDKSSRQFQTWQTKLNGAKTSLTQMETQLGQLEGSLKSETAAADQAAASAERLSGSLSRIGTGVTLANVSSAADHLKGTLESVFTAAGKVGRYLFNLGVDAGAWADGISTAAAEMGVDAETYQAWEYAAEHIGTSMEDIKSGITDVQKGMDSQKGYEKLITGLGVAYRDAAGNVRPASAVFWDAFDAINGMADQTARAQAAEMVFGKDYKKLLPLLNAGTSEWNDLTNRAREMYTVSNENVAELKNLNGDIIDFNKSFDKLKYDALAALAPTFETVAKAMSTAVQALDEFVQSEEGQEALAGLNEALAGIINNLTGENGSGFAGLVETARGAVQNLNGALEWISEHGDTVANIIKGMGIAWTGLSVASTVIRFVELISAMPLEKLRMWLGGGNTPAPTPTPAPSEPSTPSGPTGIPRGDAPVTGNDPAQKPSGRNYQPVQPVQEPSTGSTDGKAGPGILAAIGKFLGSTTAKVLSGAALTTYLVLKPAEGGNDDMFDENGRLIGDPDYDVEADPDGIFSGQAGPDNFGLNSEELKALAEQNMAGRREKQAKAASAAWDYVKGGGSDPFDDVWVQLSDAFWGEESVYEKIVARINEMAEQLQQGADPSAIGDFPLADFDLEGAVGAAVDLGERTSEGVAQGIYNKAPEVQTASEYVAQIAQRALRRALDIHSPSKVFAQLGAYTAQGFAEGITGSVSRVEQAVGAMVAATTPQPAATVGGFDLGAMAAGQASGMNEGAFAAAVASAVREAVSTIVVDMDGVAVGHAVSSTVNGDLGWREYQERYETA